MNFIDLQTQYRRIEDDVNTRIRAVLEHGQYIMGPEVAELEERLAAVRRAFKHCIAVSSGTDALLIAMMAPGHRTRATRSSPPPSPSSPPAR